MFSLVSGIPTEKKSTRRHPSNTNSTDGKFLYNFDLSGPKNFLDATSWLSGKNRNWFPTSEISFYSETKHVTNINSPRRGSRTYSKGRTKTFLLPQLNTGGRRGQNHLSRQVSMSSLPLHERGDCWTSGENSWVRRGRSSRNHSSRTQCSRGGNPGWDLQHWKLISIRIPGSSGST